MASRLSKQLEALRGESVRTKKAGVASLLFGKREAQDVDLETVYGLASNGFVELCSVDGRFSRFEEVLSEEWKRIDREKQDKDANSKLDSSLASLLKMMSPYMQLKSAHKVFEYLLRRFRQESGGAGALSPPPIMSLHSHSSLAPQQHLLWRPQTSLVRVGATA